MLPNNILEIVYLIISILIIVGLRSLTKTSTARLGNFFISSGLGLSVVITLLSFGTSNIGWIFSALIIGSVMGILSARKVRLTSAPQILAFFNGMGGAGATITSYIAFIQTPTESETLIFSSRSIFILLSIFFGVVSFAGSSLSIIKLRLILSESGITFPFQKLLNASTLTSIFVVSGFILAKTEADYYLLYLLIFLSFLYGNFFFLPISGIDSPIVISFLNSYSGLALVFSGFIYANQLMLIGGLLVGTSGLILSILFAKSLKRSILKVIFGGSISNIPSPYYHLGMEVKEITISDAAIQIKYSRRILIIPGYGMGISQTQYLCKEFEDLLIDSGVEVKYVVHPYGGRMPGHMNVLLSEANISYNKIISVQDANNSIKSYDLVLCIGANDIINPFIDRDKKNPLYGIPTIKLEMAKQIIILKRSLQPGFSGQENQLFFEKNTRVILGNLKSSLLKIINEIREI